MILMNYLRGVRLFFASTNALQNVGGCTNETKIRTEGKRARRKGGLPHPFPVGTGKSWRVLKVPGTKVLTLLMVGALLVFVANGAQARLLSHVEARGLELSRSLLKIAYHDEASARQGRERVVGLNGVQLRVQSGSILRKDRSVEELLQGVRERCFPHDAPRNDEIKSPQMIAPPLLEYSSKTEGYVYCLRPRGSLDVDGLSLLLTKFSKTGDFAELGTWQGAYARVEGERLVFFAAEFIGPLRIDEMFPVEGDSPGGDILALPRPGGRRLLTGSLDGEALLTSYEFSDSSDELLKNYADKLTLAGIEVHWPPSGDRNHTAGGVLIARTSANTFVVSAPLAANSLIINRLPH